MIYPIEIKVGFDTPNEFLASIFKTLPGLSCAVFLDMETGTPIESKSLDENLDLDTVSAFYRNVATSAHEALVAQGKATEIESPIRETLITCENEFIILQLLNGGKQMLYLLLDKSSNPGVVFGELRKNFANLERFFK